MLVHSLLFLMLLKSCTATKATVPVFVIDYDNVMSHLTIPANPFAKVSEGIFTKIIHDAIKRSDCVIIFTEENLSTEDLSRTDSLGTPYYHLQKGLKQRRALYIPAVTEPLTLLRQNFEPKSSNSFYLGSGDKLQLIRSVKYLYIYFKDNNMDMTRVRVLRKHDIIMREVYFTVRQLKTGPIIGFYTGKTNPMNVVSLQYFPKRRSMESPVNSGVMVVTKQSLFRLSGVLAASHTRRSMFNQKPVVEKETRTARSLSTTMQYTDFELQFNFALRDRDWKLANVALLEGGEEVGRTEMGVGAPWNWSYFCAEPLNVVNVRDGSSITVEHYQIQPIYRQLPNDDQLDVGRAGSYDYKDGGKYDFRRLDGADERGDNWWSRYDDQYVSYHSFGRTVNCCPYFSKTILSGLFVAFIFLMITSYGVLMLFNCGSNSRFDDPNGPQIQMNMEH